MPANSRYLEIDKIIDANYVHRLSEQLKVCDDQEIHDTLSKELEEIRSRKYVKASPKDLLKEKMQEASELMFKKNWARLNSTQHLNRMEKFLKTASYPEKIKKKVIKLAKNGKLRFFNCVDYDVASCSVKEVYCVVKNEDGKFEIDKKKIRNKDIKSERSKKLARVKAEAEKNKGGSSSDATAESEDKDDDDDDDDEEEKSKKSSKSSKSGSSKSRSSRK